MLILKTLKHFLLKGITHFGIFLVKKTNQTLNVEYFFFKIEVFSPNPELKKEDWEKLLEHLIGYL